MGPLTIVFAEILWFVIPGGHSGNFVQLLFLKNKTSWTIEMHSD